MIRILLIDDDEIIRTSLAKLLQLAGFEVEAAADGKAALQSFRAHPADVIVTDLFMPEKEGMEVIMEARRESPEVKIIAMSGGGSHGGTDYLEIAGLLGAEHTLQKPFKPRELVALIRRLMGAEEG